MKHLHLLVLIAFSFVVGCAGPMKSSSGSFNMSQKTQIAPSKPALIKKYPIKKYPSKKYSGLKIFSMKKRVPAARPLIKKMTKKNLIVQRKPSRMNKYLTDCLQSLSTPQKSSAKRWVMKKSQASNKISNKTSKNQHAQTYCETEIDKKCYNKPKMFRQYYEMALQNDVFAQYFLSILYLKGEGVHYSLDKSVYWYNKAEQATDTAYAKYKIGKLLLGSTLIQKDEKEAMKWLKASAKKHCAIAQILLGDIYYKGNQAVQCNHTKAYFWYKQAADQKHPVGQYSVGLLYYNGEGVKKDPKIAFQWFYKAAIQGEDYAQYALSRMYEEGIGVEKNSVKAYGWWLSPEKHFENPKIDYQRLVEPMSIIERAQAVELAKQNRLHYQKH